jgi:hypothetical protein
MTNIEGIKAYRPLAQDPWLRNFQEVAPEILGEDVLDFGDEALGTQEVEILGAGKFIALRDTQPEAEAADGEKLASLAEEEGPDSFHIPLPLIAYGRLGITYMTDQNEARRRVLAADIHQTRLLVKEQKGLERVVDEALGARPSAKLPFMKVKLAAVNEGHSIPEIDLRRLAYLLPARINVEPGEITSIDIGPGSVRDQRADMEDFAHEIGLDAAHDMAEAVA